MAERDDFEEATWRAFDEVFEVLQEIAHGVDLSPLLARLNDLQRAATVRRARLQPGQEPGS